MSSENNTGSHRVSNLHSLKTAAYVEHESIWSEDLMWKIFLHLVKSSQGFSVNIKLDQTFISWFTILIRVLIIYKKTNIFISLKERSNVSPAIIFKLYLAWSEKATSLRITFPPIIFGNQA